MQKLELRPLPPQSPFVQVRFSIEFRTTFHSYLRLNKDFRLFNEISLTHQSRAVPCFKLDSPTVQSCTSMSKSPNLSHAFSHALVPNKDDAHTDSGHT